MRKQAPSSTPLAHLFAFVVLIGITCVGLIWAMSLIPRKTKPPVTNQPVQTQPIEPAPSSTPVVETMPEPATTTVAPAGMTCDATNSMCVRADLVKKGIDLVSPMSVTGTAIAFENTMNWRLEDPKGKVIQQGFETTNAPDVGKPGLFSIRAFLNDPVTATGTGRFVVYEASAKDGSSIHEVAIPVRFKPIGTRSVKFYVVDASKDTECAVKGTNGSIVQTAVPVEATLTKLLNMTAGSYIPAGTKLISLVVKAGVANVVLSHELAGYGGGSCNVNGIRSEIEQTLLQFSSIKSVVISEIGKTPAETLQP